MADEIGPGVTVELASPDDCFFLDAWNRAVEGSVTRLNDALSRLVTLSTAMSGGALVLLREDLCGVWFRVGAAALFFLALGVAVAGAAPVVVEMPFRPDSVRQGFAHAAEVKRRWVLASSSCLLAGLLVAIVGAAARAAL